MGMFSNAIYDWKILDNGVVHIFDRGTDQISVTNDAENVIKRLDRDIRADYDVGGLGSMKVQYTDSEGQVDKLLQENGVFKGFASGRWTDADCL